MTTSMSEPPISASDDDTELVTARKAGWRRADLNWERLQERANELLRTGDGPGAIRCFRRAARIARWRFARSDPRRAATLANLALADRLSGREAMTGAKTAGVLLTVAGVAAALGERAYQGGAPGESAGEAWIGAAAVLASAFCGALCSIFYRPYLQRYPTLPVSAFAMLASVGFLDGFDLF